MKKILVTGGAGYIGSHTVIALIEAGFEPFIVDNFVNSRLSVIDRLGKITKQKLKFQKLDLTDQAAVAKLFDNHSFDGVIHFAAYKAVGESVNDPIKYYRNNLLSLINVIDSMKKNAINNLIFSSSCTVYGTPLKVPVTESEPLKGINPYGQTKIMGEQIIRDAFANQGSAVLLRYFNPLGAHASGLIGEDSGGIAKNLLPNIAKVAAGELKEVEVFGSDYDTPDGSGIRDYIHVMDLAAGHVVALNKLRPGIHTYNLGTGKGYTVLEIIKSFEKASGQKIAYKISPRRPGDAAVIYADPSLVAKELKWRAVKNLNQMCSDSWRWQLFNATLK